MPHTASCTIGELKQRIGKVRVTEDGLVWAVDLVLMVKGYRGKTGRSNAALELCRIPDNIFSKQNFITRSMPGKGNGRTKLVSINHALELIMVLPGDMGKRFRVHACDILKRHLSGDPTLTLETARNARIGIVAATTVFIEEAAASVRSKREGEPVQLGYVYGTQSDAFPGLVKIGRTYNLNARLVALNIGCAPKPHGYVAIAPTYDAVRDEKMTHAYFATVREEGEFFRVTAEELRCFLEHHVVLNMGLTDYALSDITLHSS